MLFECCFAWMLWKLERIDGNPVLRETRIWTTWEYVSSVGGGQQGMVGLCAHCGCGSTWMLWKLGRIDGDPALRGTRIRATWEYMSSVGGGQQGMVGYT